MPSSNPLAPPVAAKIEPGDLVDERKAAAILDTSIQTLRNWRWKRTGPRYCKVGARLVRYHIVDLQRFIDGEAAKP